ncbi:ecdysoneless cell cycle regulator [Lycorma delicatula]|uniref:ecdysoneless cell cycle regulator n=1 Tax=Lycorma delicatula TaxID=130591 RepID=UPI003F5102BE
MACKKSVLEYVREEDFVEYFLFPDNYGDNNDTPSKRELDQIMTIIKRYTINYIWQKDEFNLIARNTTSFPTVTDNEERLPPHLYGVLHYGDNIEDEWFLVFLLLQLTKEISGLVVRVVDSDGEFLLIEAADVLPKWASPETCEQRVFLHGGKVHLIPLSSSGDGGGDDDDDDDDDDNEQIKVKDAVELVRKNQEITKASDLIQNAIFNRIKGYPDRIENNLHRANAFVPVGVAALLKERPSLIAPATVAFCHRDPIDMRACRAMRFFPPENRVMTRVTFTKCLYAMLSHQKFSPDRRTGWNLPLPSDPLHAAHSLGVKIACGFEILVSQCKFANDSENLDLSLDKGWNHYYNTLKDKGYFKGLLEGSQEYNKLKKAAEDYYKSHTVISQPSTGQMILNLLNTVEYDIDEMMSEQGNLPPSDDDSWLEISADELDKMMEERYGAKQAANSMDVSSHLNKFIKHVSGLDGAEFPNTSLGESSAPPVRPPRGVKPKKAVAMDVDADDDDSSRVNFDHESFSCAVQNILDFVVPEDSWDLDSDGSGMSSYEDESEMDLGRHKRDGEHGETPVSELKQYMDQMDRELSSTTLGQSFEKKTVQPTKKGMEDSFSDIENFEPVDIDMNALKNILESYQAQMGGAGPASNLLGPMGVRLEKK